MRVSATESTLDVGGDNHNRLCRVLPAELESIVHRQIGIPSLFVTTSTVEMRCAFCNNVDCLWRTDKVIQGICVS